MLHRAPLGIDTLERGQIPSGSLEEGEDPLFPRPVLPLKRPQRPEPFGDGGQPLGIGVDDLPVGPQLRQDVLGLRDQRPGAPGDLLRPFVEPRRAVHGDGGLPKPVGRAALSPQGSFGRPGELEDPARVCQSGLVLGQGGHLARPDARRLDLSRLVGEQVLLPFAVAGQCVESLEPGAGVAAFGMDGSVLLQRVEVPRAREPVEEVHLGRGAQQALGLVLAMDLDQALADGDEGRDRRQAAGDARAGPAV